MFEGNLPKNISSVIFTVKMMSYFLLKCLDNFFLMNEPKDVSFGIWTNISYSHNVLYINCTLICFVHFQHIFFGGLDPHLRHETWPFLLHYYPWDSTFEEREAIRNDRYIQYQDIRKMRYNTGFQILNCLWYNLVAKNHKHIQL